MKPTARERTITDRQIEVLNFIISFKESNGYSPTHREVADKMGITVKGAFDHIESLEKKGYLKHTYNVARSIVVLKIPEKVA